MTNASRTVEEIRERIVHRLIAARELFSRDTKTAEDTILQDDIRTCRHILYFIDNPDINSVEDYNNRGDELINEIQTRF